VVGGQAEERVAVEVGEEQQHCLEHSGHLGFVSCGRI
jgi:hypothetical protein